MAAIIYYIFGLTMSIYVCTAYKALVVTQMPSRSHSVLNNGIVKQLLKDGNEVTFIRSINYHNAPSTLRQIDVSSNEKALPPESINIKAIMNKLNEGNDYEYMKRMMINIAINTLENEDVQKLLSDSNEYFDVVVVEFMDNDILASFATVFDCPLIWMSPKEITSNILSRIDALPNPAHINDCYSTNTGPFSFRERIESLWYRMKLLFLDYWYFDEMQIEAYNRLVVPHIIKRGRQPPSFNDIRYNISLVLGYSHVSMGHPASLPQSYKPVGGYHIDDNIKPLPEDLKRIMDNSKDGVIYFSMGSNLKSTEFPEETKQSLLQMLGGLQQTVLWKFEEQIPNNYKNVHVSSWFPQMSILSHPNCAIFITHGGLLSIAEALYVGVPLIGIPGFSDQFVNTKKVVQKGFALEVDMSYNIVEDLKAAINKMMSDHSYRKKAKELSFVYHDRPVKPAEEISHWVRHVVETHGAPHLRSPALDVPLYQLFYLDLVGLILIVLVFILKLLSYVCSLIFPTKNKESNVKAKQKRKKNN